MRERKKGIVQPMFFLVAFSFFLYNKLLCHNDENQVDRQRKKQLQVIEKRKKRQRTLHILTEQNRCAYIVVQGQPISYK